MWDTASGRLLHQIDITEITSAVFGADSRTLVLGGDDGVTRLWDLSKETYTGLASSDTQWVVYTPNGHFDGSPRAGELLAIAQGRRAFGVDQFALVNNRPDLIIDQLGFGKSDVIRHYAALHERRVRRFQARLQTGGFTEETQPSPSFDLDLPSARFLSSRQTDGYVDLSISFSDDRHPLAFYNVYVNDVPVFSGFGAPLERNQTAERDIRVTLTQGLNKIEGGVFNAVGSEALRALTLATYNPEVASRGSLYYIGFGTSKYAVRDLNLDYAHKDALDLARMFGLAQGYRDVHTLTFTDQEVTLDNIRRAKALLRTAQVEDTVVLFISGHGKHEDTAEATYYYLTHDADPGHLAETAADFEMIEATLSGIPPRYVSTSLRQWPAAFTESPCRTLAA